MLLMSSKYRRSCTLVKAYRERNKRRKSAAFWASKVGDWLGVGSQALESEPVKREKKHALINHPVCSGGLYHPVRLGFIPGISPYKEEQRNPGCINHFGIR